MLVKQKQCLPPFNVLIFEIEIAISQNNEFLSMSSSSFRHLIEGRCLKITSKNYMAVPKRSLIIVFSKRNSFANALQITVPEIESTRFHLEHVFSTKYNKPLKVSTSLVVRCAILCSYLNVLCISYRFENWIDLVFKVYLTSKSFQAVLFEAK